MLTRDKILAIIKQKDILLTRDLVEAFGVSRQYASAMIAELAAEEKLIKLGSTRKAFYVLPEYAQKNKGIFPAQYSKTFKNVSLEEHRVLEQITQTFPPLNRLPENVRSIFIYTFTEMLNNAIEHSTAPRIKVEVSIRKKLLSFIISDSGIGVFRNIMEKRDLKSELEAIQELMKGKTTTMPKSHTGEGIFFTSKAGNLFILNSFGYQLIVNNEIPDIFIEKPEKAKRGTQVIFNINISSHLQLNDLFRQYTNTGKDSDYGFDKTKIQVKLYTIDGIYISRSQARRVLAGLEKFRAIEFDFNKVPLAGQAFADEIFRVFHNKHPEIALEAINMNEGVKFMVARARKTEQLSQTQS